MILLKNDERHLPHVSCALGAAALRNEVDVFAVFAPYGTEVISGMVCQLLEAGTVSATNKDIGVRIFRCTVHEHTAAYQ